jgi:Protein of unknown function (DUF1761)
MQFAGMNYWAIVAAAAASFVFGGIWYSVLAKPWMAAVGKSEAEIRQTGMITPMVVTVVCQLVMAWVLAGVIGHLGAGQVTWRNGLISGAFCWLGFVLTSLVVNHAFQGSKRMLTLIDGGHWLGVLLIQGTVIGLLGV